MNISGRRDHAIVEYGKQVLLNLMHRGAAGADESTGDGAGILLQIPHEFFAAEADRLGFELPAPSQYGVAMVFLPAGRRRRGAVRGRCSPRRSAEAGSKVLGLARRADRQRAAWATSPGQSEPVDPPGVHRRRGLSRTRRWSGGCSWSASGPSSACAQRWATRPSEFYVPSMSCRTIVYKGMFLAPQLFAYYPDLADQRMVTALAIVHQRYSTNTFPSWRLAQPFRMIAHNGEINTLRGNINRLQGYEKTMACPALGRGPVGPVPDPRAGRQRLGLLRQRDGTAGPRRPLGAARHDDDDSRGVRAAVSHQRPTSGRSTNTTPRSWSPGTARRPWSSPTAGWSAARWTATACGPAATWSPPTGWWCWPARSA